MTEDAQQEHFLGALGIWPLLILIVAAVAYPVLEGSQPTLQGPATGGWVRLVFFSVAYVLAGVQVLPHFSTVFAAARRMWVYLLLLGLMLASAYWSSFPDKVFFNVIHGVGLLLVAGAAALYAATRPSGFFAPVALVTTIIVALSAAVVVLHPSLGIEPNDMYGPAVNRWRGITDTSNTLGSTAATAICCCLAVFFAHPSRFYSRLALCAMPVSAFVLIVGCRSMTSVLATFAFVGTFVLLRSMEQDGVGVRWLKVSGIALLVVLVLSLLFLLNPEFSIVDSFFSATGRSKTLTGRTQLWQTALKLIDMKPMLGWSFDSIASARKYLSGAMGYGQFHNGYLDLTVRGGYIGLLLLVLMILRSVRAAFQQLGLSYRKGMGSLAVLVFVLIANMAESNFVVEGSPIWFLFMVGWMSAETQLRLWEQQQPEESP